MFEILSICCFREVTPYIEEVRRDGWGWDHVICLDVIVQIVKLSLELLSYDPNYNYESDDEDEGMDTDELEQDELYGFIVHVNYFLI